MRIEDANNLGNLHGSSKYGFIRPRKEAVKPGFLTGSSALFVLLSVDEALLTSSIMLERSLPMSSRRSESFSASL